MEQLPSNELQNFADSDPEDFMGKVLSYWNDRAGLLQSMQYHDVD